MELQVISMDLLLEWDVPTKTPLTLGNLDYLQYLVPRILTWLWDGTTFNLPQPMNGMEYLI